MIVDGSHVYYHGIEWNVEVLYTEVVYDCRSADVTRHAIEGCVPVGQWGLEITRLRVNLFMVLLASGRHT